MFYALSIPEKVIYILCTFRDVTEHADTHIGPNICLVSGISYHSGLPIRICGELESRLEIGITHSRNSTMRSFFRFRFKL